MRAYKVKKKKGVFTCPYEFQTRISHIIRKDNRIMFPISLPNNFKYRNVFWTVRFFPSGVPTLLTTSSVAFIHSHPKLFDSILFPKLFYKSRIWSCLQDEFNDPTLNDDQNAFIRTVLQRTSLAFHEYEIESELNLPTLLVGPFGTGKTMTFVKALQGIVNQFEKSKILAIAPSQSAADTIALKLLSIGMEANKIFRFNSPLRDIFSLPWKLTGIVAVEDGLFVFPQNILEYSIVICTTTDAQLLVHSKYTNLDISEIRKETIDNVNEELKYCGLPPYKYDDQLFHWTHLAGI